MAGGKILVVSDTHGRSDLLGAVINRETAFDALVHCGDGVTDIFSVGIPQNVSVLKVMGNVDAARGLDMERIFVSDIFGERILVLHGDMHRAKQTLEDIMATAMQINARRVFFGHTHIPFFSEMENITLFNPGALKQGSYGVISVENGKWQYALRAISTVSDDVFSSETFAS